MNEVISQQADVVETPVNLDNGGLQPLVNEDEVIVGFVQTKEDLGEAEAVD